MRNPEIEASLERLGIAVEKLPENRQRAFNTYLEREIVKEKEIMDVHEVAEFLGFTEITIYNLLSKNKIPARKISNRWRFLRSEIVEWFLAKDTGKKKKKKKGKK